METSIVVPSINTTTVMREPVTELRRVYMKYAWDGFKRMVLGLAMVVFYCSPLMMSQHQETASHGVIAIFLFVEMLPLPLILLSFFLVNLFLMIVARRFVYLLDGGRGDLIGECRKNKFVQYLLTLNRDAYRSLKDIDDNQRRSDQNDTEQGDDRRAASAAIIRSCPQPHNAVNDDESRHANTSAIILSYPRSQNFTEGNTNTTTAIVTSSISFN